MWWGKYWWIWQNIRYLPIFYVSNTFSYPYRHLRVEEGITIGTSYRHLLFNLVLELVLELSGCCHTCPLNYCWNHLPVIYLIIGNIRIVAITKISLAFTFHTSYLLARCVSLVYSEFKHTYYYYTHVYSLVEYLFKLIVSSTKFLGSYFKTLYINTFAWYFSAIPSR